MKNVLAVAALCVLLAGSSAFGSIMVNAAAPTGDLAKVAQPTGGGQVSDPYYTGARRAFGATWTLQGTETPFQLNAITMRLRVGTEAETPLGGSAWVASVFTLSADNDVTPDTWLANRVAVGNLAPLTYSADNYVTFVLPEEISIAAGQFYGFIVDFAGSNANNQINGSGTGWVLSSNNDRSDSFGLIATNDAGPFGLQSAGGDDAIFWLGTVPEPTTMALLAIGAVGALIRRRK